ncbi:hypothetical protein [Paraburkholderia caballeronis]|nr:hypothetical protein [Paraburkholderia caballeronis]
MRLVEAALAPERRHHGHRRERADLLPWHPHERPCVLRAAAPK